MNKITIIVGIVCGSFFAGLFLHTEHTRLILETIQALVITLVTIFTAWWTSKTFGFKQKSEEAKEVKKTLSELRVIVDSINTHQSLVRLNKLTEKITPPDQKYIDFLQERTDELDLEFRRLMFDLKTEHETFVTLNLLLHIYYLI